MSINTHAWTHRPEALGGTDPIEVQHLIEVATFESATDWPAGYATLEFTRLSSSFTSTVEVEGDEWQAIDVNAGGNIVIAKDGFYEVAANFRNSVQDVNVTTTREFQMVRVAGEFPIGMQGDAWTGGSTHSAIWAHRINPNSVADLDVATKPRPWFTDWLMLQQGSFDPGTAGVTEFECYAQKEEDNVATAETFVVVNVIIIRHGTLFQS